MEHVDLDTNTDITSCRDWSDAPSDSIASTTCHVSMSAVRTRIPGIHFEILPRSFKCDEATPKVPPS